MTISPCQSSDWSEENTEITAATNREPEAEQTPSSPSHHLSPGTPKQGPLLQGSATEVRTRLPAGRPAYSGRTATPAEIAQIDQDANNFLARAQTDQIITPPIFRAFIENNYPRFLLQSQKNNDTALVVVRGQWDNSTLPLQSFGLKYTSIKTRNLNDQDLSKIKVLIVDCAGEVPRSTLQKIRDYVAHGGYLVSTDWSLNNLLAKAFPGYIQWSGENTNGAITDALVLNSDSALFTGITDRRHTWKLDKLSQEVRVMNPSKVRVLARSSKLAVRDAQFHVLSNPLLAGALACEFNFGHGKVLHLVGHFDNCANIFKRNLLPDPAPGIGISLRQAITANFIIEGLSKNPQESPDASELPN